MSQTKTPKERKPKATPTMVNNGISSHKNTSVQKVVKETGKTDSKSEHGKPSEKFQPTAEQMRIAQIIDTKSEDPSLKDKLKQVMDATQRSVDDAFTALHDSDNDPNRAVNLLLERGNKPDEWSTSSKKKKVRSPNEKKEVEKEVAPPAETEDCWNALPSTRPNKTSEPSRGSTRNRPFHKVARGKPIGTNENEKPKPRRGELNGPSRGGKSFRGGRQSGRGFGRGSRSGFRRTSTFDTWNQDSENQPSNNHFNQNVDDWDSEEYTGSLANSQVFTPSASVEPTAVMHGTSANSSFQSSQDQDDSKERLPDRTPTSECGTTSITPPQILSHYALQQPRTLQTSPPSINKTNISIAESILHENKGAPLSHAGDSQSTMCQQVSALMSKSEFMYSSVGRGRSLGLMSYSQPAEDVRIQRINPTTTTTAASVVATAAKPKPRVPPPSKIPSTAVEMPPDADSAIGLLDVQFGALEFGENSSEPVHNSPPSSRPSTPSPQPSENIVSSGITATESILSNDSRSFSPSPGTGSNSLTSQIVIETSKIPESTSSSLYQDNVYQTSSSLYTKPTPHSQSIYNQEYNSSHSQRPGQIITSNNIIYSTSSNTLSTYASSSAGSYGNSSYPNYQYPNYPLISQPSTIPTSSSTNSYQVTVSAQPYSSNSQSVYGSSGLGTSSYNSPYQYNQLNHKSLGSSTPNSKEQFDSSTPSVNLNSISHSSSMSGANNTLLSSSQATPVSKPSSASSMAAKGAVVASMPPVPGLVGTHQYIVGQGGVPYFQQPHTMYYEDLQLMPQQRLPHHITTGYYEMGYQPTTTREGVQYNMSDGRFARADNTSPVQVSSMNQQSGTHAQQQPLMNPTAMPPAYAYFYGGSMIPGNFQFGAPTLYPVAATGTSTAHGSSSSGVYGKPSNYSGNYSGMYDSNQSNIAEYKSSSTPGPKSQSTTVVNPSTSADIPMMYSKSHSALSKVGSYDKAGFHCPTPPPFNLGSQNSGIAPAGGYPQHLFIPTITPHHNTPLMHQPMHQDNTNTVNSRSAINNNPNKNAAKSNYSSSTSYWTPN